MKKILRIGAVAIVALITIGLGMYLFQDRLIFQGESLNGSHQFTFNYSYREHFISTPDGEKLNVLWFSPEKETRGLIVYFHGNADNLQRWGKYAADFLNLGYEVVMIDYRGYGKSTGSPSENTLYADAAQFWQWVNEQRPSGIKIIYGRSLGSAIASKLASEVNPHLLILETPFENIRGTQAGRLLYRRVPLNYDFPTKTFLQSVKCRILIFHGTDDWVVPLALAEPLKDVLKKDDRFIVVEGANHKNINEYVIYHTTLARSLP